MFCPKCSKENPEGAQLCSSCSSVLTNASVMPAATTKTSGMAITSFVLGMLSFTCFIFTAIPAIILGIISLGKIKRSNGQLTGRGFAIAGIAVPSAALVIAVLFIIPTIMAIPLMRGRIDAAKWSEGKAMMGIIASAIRAYRVEKGADAAPPTTIVGTGDTALGFAATDLDGKYFQNSDFTMNVTSMNPLLFTITCTASKPDAPKVPKTVTLNQDGVWTP
jgi:type IV pilus assembly protein PilA